MITPLPLRKGDTIGIFAPSSRADKAKVKAGVAALEHAGYSVYVHPQTWEKDGQSAGTAGTKTKALHNLFRNPDIRAIICAHGGNRASAMVPLLDYKLIRANPKILMGYSDVTSLLNAIQTETGLVTFHGPMLHGLGTGKPNRKQTAQCFALLEGEKTEIPMTKVKVIHPGKASGRMIGGNLSLICSQMGTKWQPDFKEAIVFLEDCDDELSRYDRMLQHLANANIFKDASGIIFGSFTHNKDTGSLPFGFTMEQIIRNATTGLKKPVVMNTPFGHGKDLYTFPVGGYAELAATPRGASLKLKTAV